MDIEYLSAKNQEQTVKINGVFLHSSYNPSKEAERFVHSINNEFSPKYIFIFEPGLSFILPFLRERFPDCKIGCLNTLKLKNNFNFDFEFFELEKFKSCLFQNIPEEEIFLTLFLSWEPSQKLFPELFTTYSEILKKIIEDSKTLLITRQYFEKKWLINSANFLRYGNYFCSIKTKIDTPIVICASGPSLKKVIPYLQQYRKKFFLICLSSAIYTLYRNQIIPDMYFSTDGGFWANFHLRKIQKDIPLVISPESFVNKNILRNNLLLPIIYTDGFSRNIQNYSKIQFLEGERNGTVSGTALKFSLNFTTNIVYFTGLDLCSSTEYQHTQPNELEIRNCVFDNRIKPLESRLYPSTLPNSSLSIYKEWFDNQTYNKRVFRIIDSSDKHNSISSIPDISIEEFEKKLYTKNIFNINLITKYNRDEKLINNECVEYYTYLQNIFSEDENLKNIFSLDYISSLRNKENKEIKEKLYLEKTKLLYKLKDILNG